MHIVQTILTKVFIRLFGLLPFGLLYAFSDLLFFLVYHVFKYRRKVVLENLQNSFPEKKPAEISQIHWAYYRYLCDLLVEGIKGMSMSVADFRKRFVYKNPEIFTPLFENKQSAILLGSHYGNWEWGSISFQLAVSHQVLGIYKPIKNKPLENYLNKEREKFGLHLSTMQKAGRAIIEHKNTPTIIVLIADQTPVDIRNAHWINFLHQETPFLHGMEKLAIQTGYPVFHFKINSIKRGYYEVYFEEICSDPKSTDEGEITALYARQLERMIRENPPFWLWSHRRWKRKRV